MDLEAGMLTFGLPHINSFPPSGSSCKCLLYKSQASSGGLRFQLEIWDSDNSHYFYIGGA